MKKRGQCGEGKAFNEAIKDKENHQKWSGWYTKGGSSNKGETVVIEAHGGGYDFYWEYDNIETTED